MALLDEATEAGARLGEACRVLGLSIRTIQRWKRGEDAGDDARKGPATRPANALTPAEKQEILSVVNSREFCGLSPKQIVPCLADQGTYLASL